MKVGVITNLNTIQRFVQRDLAAADAKSWMNATGGNTGNVAFVQGVMNILGADLGIVSWGDDPATVSKHYDHLVVCCANQLGAHVDLSGWADRLSQFELPVTLIGLGAQSEKIGDIPELPEGTKKFLQIVNTRRRFDAETNILTRGKFTTSVVHSQGYESAPLGCPSQFISSESGLGASCFNKKRRGRSSRVMVAAGNPWHRSYSLDTTLVKIVQEHMGCYVLQHPVALFELASKVTANLTDHQVRRIEEIYASLGGIAEIEDWFSSFATYFADAQNWMHYSKRYDLALGPRYHGVALPIQAGVQGKVISIDSRTEELSATTGVPYISFDEVRDFDSNSIIEACYWSKDDALNYDQVRESNAQMYVKFLQANGLIVSDHLLQLAA